MREQGCTQLGQYIPRNRRPELRRWIAYRQLTERVDVGITHIVDARRGQ